MPSYVKEQGQSQTHLGKELETFFMIGCTDQTRMELDMFHWVGLDRII